MRPVSHGRPGPSRGAVGGAMHGSRLRPYLLPFVAALIVLAVGVGSAIAAIPTRNGTYYACLTKSSGVVRLINYPKVKCATGERFIKWNAKGPAGPAGLSGPQGVQGVQGDQGAKGDPGPADWNVIPNVPTGFADGMDNEGVTAVKLTRMHGASVSVAPDAWGIASVSCPSGSKVTGGGAWSGTRLLHTTNSIPTSGGWEVAAHNTGGGSATLQAWAVCMSVEPEGAITMAKKGVQPAKLHKKHK
jgi:hypothetical protein